MNKAVAVALSVSTRVMMEMRNEKAARQARAGEQDGGPPGNRDILCFDRTKVVVNTIQKECNLDSKHH